jgi:hypothetical protein
MHQVTGKVSTDGRKGQSFPCCDESITRKISIFPDSGRLISIVWLDGRRLLVGLHITSPCVHARPQLHILRGGRATSECPVEFSHPFHFSPQPTKLSRSRKGKENRCQLFFPSLITWCRFRESTSAEMLMVTSCCDQ